MKRIFYNFRSDIKQLEYYHEYKTLEEFKKKCHDFYLLQAIWFLENNYIDEFVTWRLQPKQRQNNITFNINGKLFIQKWVGNLDEVLNYPTPIISFFRGGFKIYCDLVKKANNKLGTTLYCGTSSRITPQYGGKYDKILVEDYNELDSSNIPFYKTASSEIFYPNTTPTFEKEYDIIWPCNCTQLKYKGQEFFIKKVSESKYLQSLKILHTGNKPEVLMQLCKKYGVKNIKFVGLVTRPELNKLLNSAKFGLVTSNLNDGCPRIVTEIMMSGTPLLLRKKTRLLDYYKQKGVVIIFEDKKIESKIKEAMDNYNKHRDDMLSAIHNELSMETICKLNWKLWTKK